MNREEILFFLTGGLGLKPEIPNPDPSWISEKMWGELCVIVQLDVFKGFLLVRIHSSFHRKRLIAKPLFCPLPSKCFTF